MFDKAVFTRKIEEYVSNALSEHRENMKAQESKHKDQTKHGAQNTTGNLGL